MITSIKNPLVKELRKLRQLKGRRLQGVYLLEGTNLLEAACGVGCSLVTLCYTSEWQGRYPQLWEEAIALSQRSEQVSEEVIQAIATTVNPDGVIATISNTAYPQTPPETVKLGLILEQIQDPGNLGTIIRTAAATGVEGLWMSTDTVNIGNPKVLRASVGAWFQVKMSVQDSLVEWVRGQQKQGMRAIATAANATKTYWDIDWTQPSLILLGNEASGLSPELLSLSDEQVSIPVNPPVESLNVAIATALLLYEVQRQRQ